MLVGWIFRPLASTKAGATLSVTSFNQICFSNSEVDTEISAPVLSIAIYSIPSRVMGVFGSPATGIVFEVALLSIPLGASHCGIVLPAPLCQAPYPFP